MKESLDQHCASIRVNMNELDSHAKENVSSGKGGPFAARLVLFAKNKQGECHQYHTNPIATNRVLETGIASHHAEAQALEPAQIGTIKHMIAKMAADRQTTPVLVLFSSAQPCMACLTKIEIVARHFVHENLIQPKDFILVFGANYEQTEKVAGFHDYAYALDFFNFKNNPRSVYSLISQEERGAETLPPDVKDLIENNTVIDAILLRDSHIMGIGLDQRSHGNLFNTAECTALHAASRLLKKEGNTEPWNLRGSHLYTLNPDIGPLSYTECQWAGVDKIVTITQPASRLVCGAPSKYLDCPHCPSNSLLFKKISEGYNTPWSAVHVVHDRDFPNEAQKEWASRTNRICYNGHEAGSALTTEEKHIFDNLFVPVSVRTS